MIAARDASGKMLMTAQHFRFSGLSKAMKAEIDTGVLGSDLSCAKLDAAPCRWLRRGLAFILKEIATGGACIDIGVHILDLTLWFMGNPKPIA